MSNPDDVGLGVALPEIIQSAHSLGLTSLNSYVIWAMESGARGAFHFEGRAWDGPTLEAALAQRASSSE